MAKPKNFLCLMFTLEDVLFVFTALAALAAGTVLIAALWFGIPTAQAADVSPAVETKTAVTPRSDAGAEAPIEATWSHGAHWIVGPW